MSKGTVNKVILIGNLGEDPTSHPLSSGGFITNFKMATTESWRDKATGEEREKTEWHRVAVFGKLAEVAKNYLVKGSKVYIEGQNETTPWRDNDGVERFSTQVVVKGFSGTLEMLGKKPQ